jgi:hypothetical protein
MKLSYFLRHGGPLSMTFRGVPFILKAAVFLLLGLGGARESHAMGDFGSILRGFWGDVISSYWYSSRTEYRLRNMYGLLNPPSDTVQPMDFLSGETEPAGLELTLPPGTSRPRQNGEIRCEDFRVVRLSDVAPGDRQIFRIIYPKSALYYEVWGGLLAGLGRPTYATFWIAAMLPEGAVPIFNEGGRGLNPRVLQKRFLAEVGYDTGLATMPPERFSLIDTVKCDGFEIYVVEYD